MSAFREQAQQVAKGWLLSPIPMSPSALYEAIESALLAAYQRGQREMRDAAVALIEERAAEHQRRAEGTDWPRQRALSIEAYEAEMNRATALAALPIKEAP